MSEKPRGTIDLADTLVGLHRNGEAHQMAIPPGPPRRIEGLTIGAPFMTREPPHAGEMHPDGDELLFLLSGMVTVVLEDEEPPRRVSLAPGQALVVPRGVWHRVVLGEPSQILHITSGPGGEHRPLTRRRSSIVLDEHMKSSHRPRGRLGVARGAAANNLGARLEANWTSWIRSPGS